MKDLINLINASIASFEAGNCARHSVYTDLLYLVPSVGVQQLIDNLPLEWRERFIDWLIEHYGNDVPVEEFLAIGLSEEELNMKPDPIELVREWLRLRNGT